MSRLDRLWRIAGTGIAFIAFGMGGLAMATLLFPFVVLLSKDRNARHRRIQFLIQTSFQVFVRAICLLKIIDLRVAGSHRLTNARGTLVISNHPSLLDVVILVSLLPRVRCIVKHEIWRNPFMRPVVVGADYIRNDLEPEALIQRCASALRDGDNLIIFPEGTRTVPGHPMEWRRGFANIAVAAQADIQLVTIDCEPVFLPKGRAWYDVPVRRPVYQVRIGERLDISTFLSYPFRPQSVRRLTSFVHQYYTENSGYVRSGVGA